MTGAIESAQQILSKGAPHPDADAYERPGSAEVQQIMSAEVQVPASGLTLLLRNGRPAPVLVTARRKTQLAVKRVMDIVGALTGLIVLAAPLLAIAALVKLTSAGPVFFRQERVGLDGRVFRLLKFRTVRSEATDQSGLVQVAHNDERLTPIGGFLRTTSIDELPQLWNILIGEMSMVGPRPMVPGMQAAGGDYERLVPYYDWRTQMTPGLSGWAQANGLRGPTDDAASATARIVHDCAYIQNFSLILDLRIILKTVSGQFLTGSGV